MSLLFIFLLFEFDLLDDVSKDRPVLAYKLLTDDENIYEF